MAYTYTNSKGDTYILHSTSSVTSTGKTRTLYYFSKVEKDSALDAVPDGYMVVESKTGLPVLKKTS